MRLNLVLFLVLSVWGLERGASAGVRELESCRVHVKFDSFKCPQPDQSEYGDLSDTWSCPNGEYLKEISLGFCEWDPFYSRRRYLSADPDISHRTNQSVHVSCFNVARTWAKDFPRCKHGVNLFGSITCCR